jgi:hypothetical protein
LENFGHKINSSSIYQIYNFFHLLFESRSNLQWNHHQYITIYSNSWTFQLIFHLFNFSQTLKFFVNKNNLFHLKLISIFLHMLTDLIVNIHWPSTIALSPIVATRLNCFQAPLREDLKPIFWRQIEAFIFSNIEKHLHDPFSKIYKFPYKFKHALINATKSLISKQISISSYHYPNLLLATPSSL